MGGRDWDGQERPTEKVWVCIEVQHLRITEFSHEEIESMSLQLKLLLGHSGVTKATDNFFDSSEVL